MELDELLQGVTGTPTPPASGGTSQPSAIDYKALAAALEPSLVKMVEQQWQSGKDKRIANLTGQVDEFQKKLERYLEHAGLTKDKEALYRLQVEDLIEQQQTGGATNTVTGSGNTGGTGQPKPSIDVETLQALDLDPNSPEVSELLRKGATLEDYVGLVKRRKAKPAPTAAAMQPSGQGSTVVSDDYESLSEELGKLVQSASAANMGKIKEINAKLKTLQPKT